MKKIKPGFTLVELIIYMGLLAIFLVVLTDLFVAILDVRLKSQSTSYVEQDGRYILARLNYALHSPINVIQNPVNLGDSSDTLTYATNFFTNSYFLNNDNLQFSTTVFGGYTGNLNSSETTISNLSFTKIGNPSGKETIKIQFTVNSKVQTTSGPKSKTFTTTVGRR